MTIASSTVSSGTTTNDASISLTFTSSEATSTFTESDITVSGGTLSSFVVSSSTVYTATFTPVGDGSTTIDVGANTFTDVAGNTNTAASPFTWIYDGTSPTMTIASSTVSSGTTTNDASISLTFTSSEATSTFTESDITVSGGTLSSFVVSSSTVYTATFTPVGDGSTTIDVGANTFTDVAGNTNTAASPFTWIYDGTSPTMTIASSTVSSGTTTNDASISLTFTSSEATSTFTESDITVSGGTLSSFVVSSSTVYTATFTPVGDGSTTIDVGANTFTDVAGNTNTAASPFTWIYDGTSPTMTIASSTVSSGTTTNDASISLTFTSSEATSTFTESDITVSGGTLSSFVVSSSTVYTATFTPVGDGSTTIDVGANTFTDVAGNTNTAASPFTWIYDGTSPTISISVSNIDGQTILNGSSTSDTLLIITFNISEQTENFSFSDLNIPNTTITNFIKISNTVYTCTISPNDEVEIIFKTDSNLFTDLAGNSNFSSNEIKWTYYDTPPRMVISAFKNEISLTNESVINDSILSIVFTSNEDILDFTIDDISISQGLLDSFAGNGKVFTADFIALNEGEYSISVDDSSFTDIRGNYNIPVVPFTWTFDVTPPLTTLNFYDINNEAIATGDTTNSDSINLNISLSEKIINFDINDLTVSNGSISLINGSDSSFNARFFPDSDGTINFIFKDSAFTDEAGNYNLVSDSYSLTYDGTGPLISISSNDVIIGSATNVKTIGLIFNASEIVSNLNKNDLILSNGTIDTLLKVNGKVYNLNFTTAIDGECILKILPGSFLDLHGNINSEEVAFYWYHDETGPVMNINSTTLSKSSTTNDTLVALRFVSSEPTRDFTIDDITSNNGVLNSFSKINDTLYTSIFSPTNDGECTVNVGEGTFRDTVGNYNNATTLLYSHIFNWTYDGTGPFIDISSSTVLSGSKTNDSHISIAFTINEPTFDFNQEDITIVNGVLSSFSSLSPTIYNAIVAPDLDGEVSIKILPNVFKDIPGNNNNQSDIFVWSYDGTPPTVSISATNSLGQNLPDGITTNDTTIALSLISSEITTNFELFDIVLTNGALNSFSGSGNTYTAILSPFNDGPVTVSILSNTYTDSVGNNNLPSNPFTWNYDGTPPYISDINILDDNSAITITMSENVFSDSDASDILDVEDFKLSLIGGVSTLDGLFDKHNSGW